VSDLSPQQRNRFVGIAMMVSAATCFSCLDSSAKWLGQAMDPLQTAALRYVGSFMLSGLFLNPLTRPAVMRTRSLWLQVARALCLVVSTIAAFFALHFLPLTVTTSISFASPLLVALLAGPLLGEWIGSRRLIAVLVGFAGVLVVTRPGTGFHPAMLFSVLTALVYAFYAVATRALSTRDPSDTTLMYTGLVGSLVLLPIVPFVWTTPASFGVWLAAAGMAAFGALGHWMVILAHKRAPASVLAPFSYAQLPCATGLGFAIFGEAPDGWTLAGGAIIMGSGLYLVHRERLQNRTPSADNPV
jgi:drug/metabolite transporter (DMT)-like permease